MLSIDGSFQLHSSGCKHDRSFMALALIVSEKMTLTQKLDTNLPSQQTVKTRSRLRIDGSVELHSSRCMHDQSFMALALSVSEKMTLTQNSAKVYAANDEGDDNDTQKAIHMSRFCFQGETKKSESSPYMSVVQARISHAVAFISFMNSPGSMQDAPMLSVYTPSRTDYIFSCAAQLFSVSLFSIFIITVY